jgi:hypothetical protein
MRATGVRIMLLAWLCAGCTTSSTPGSSGLSISASPKAIDNRGSPTTLTFTALGPDGGAGSGSVVVTSPAGAFGNGKLYDSVPLNAQGQATDTFRCSVLADINCVGSTRITASWGGAVASLPLSLGATDGGGLDAGPDAGEDAGPPVDAGPPANIVFVNDGGTAVVLGIQASGVNTSTALTFQVVDLQGIGVPAVPVAFTLTGAGGAQIAPTSAITDNNGLASTTLQSGNEVGVASVTATVTGTALYVTTGVGVVGAKPSDEGFVASCQQINLAANATVNPPRNDITTFCSAKLNDRYSNPIGIATPVQWFAEAGSINTPINTIPFDPGGAIIPDPNVGISTTSFSTAGKWPPTDTAPLAGEPDAPTTDPNWAATGKNPRDMLVTIIAVASGEEEFYDGSGTSNGVKNGKWDPGEWFVDVSEPFIDANDNQQYDPGEVFIDEPQLNCVTGVIEPKNGKWDPPNGCWDSNILLWRTMHVVYSGTPTQLVLSQPGPYMVPPSSGDLLLGYRFWDDFFMRLAPDNANVTAAVLAGERGAVNLYPEDAMNFRGFGFEIAYDRLQVTQGADGGFTVDGACDPSLPYTYSTTLPIGTRCMRQYIVRNFQSVGNFGQIDLIGQSPTPDGGPTTATIQVTPSNKETSATLSFQATFQ